MAKKQPQVVNIDKQPGQIQTTGGPTPGYITRPLIAWGNPANPFSADVWRRWVLGQPIAVLCRDTLANYLLSLDYSITARDSEKQDELKDEIKHYQTLFERGDISRTTFDMTSHIEWAIKDLFDLPFGTASELGRENDDPEGKVIWIKPMDGGTLSPTLNLDFPVAQHYPNYSPVYFPKEFVSRIFLSPRTEIQREGWGMAPPEKIYLAMEMINRGDIYYAQLLLNTPEAGILDLGDMDKQSATDWVNAFKDLLFGINPLKIPVLYEHTEPAKWIPFGKNPNDIMYDSIMSRYINIVTAGYGLTPSDVGLGSSKGNGGETLAGTIRQERQSARSGKALAKKKLEAYFDNILPETLKFNWIDFDDEKQVSTSRARMASASASDLWIANQMFSPDEMRRQAIADGLVTIPLPETIDRSKIEWPANALRYIGKNTAEPKGQGQVGNPQKPSLGGQGDTIPQQVISRSRAKIEVALSKAIYKSNQILGTLINNFRKEPILGWEDEFDNSLVGKSIMDLVSESIIDNTYNNLVENIGGSEWFDTVSVEIVKSLKSDEPSQKLIEIKNELIQKLLPKIIQLSKNEVLGWDKYVLDLTDITDNNNLKLAKSIAEKAYTYLVEITNEILGDNKSNERI